MESTSDESYEPRPLPGEAQAHGGCNSVVVSLYEESTQLLERFLPARGLVVSVPGAPDDISS